MEKIDILLVAVLIFGAATFFAISYCRFLSNIVSRHSHIFDLHNQTLNDLSKVSINFNNQQKSQNEINKSIIENITKVDNKLINVLKEIDRIKAKVDASPSPTGGGEADAEP